MKYNTQEIFLNIQIINLYFYINGFALMRVKFIWKCLIFTIFNFFAQAVKVGTKEN